MANSVRPTLIPHAYECNPGTASCRIIISVFSHEFSPGIDFIINYIAKNKSKPFYDELYQYENYPNELSCFNEHKMIYNILYEKSYNHPSLKFEIKTYRDVHNI